MNTKDSLGSFVWLQLINSQSTDLKQKKKDYNKVCKAARKSDRSSEMLSDYGFYQYSQW